MPATVAAVVLDGPVDQPRLLVVRTRSGRRWTLPKGKVGRHERPVDAAVRETLEEAGQRCVPVSGRPVGHYRHGGRRVDVYLLAPAPADRDTVAEPGREPTWLPVADALVVLGHRRDPAHIAGVAGTVAAAVCQWAAARRTLPDLQPTAR